MSVPMAGPQPAGNSASRDAERVGGTPLVSRIPSVRDGAAAARESEELAQAEALDYRTLIDECVTRKDWIELFKGLRDSESVSAATLLVRLRFGMPPLDAAVADQPISIRERFGLWDDEDDDLETSPGTAKEIS